MGGFDVHDGHCNNVLPSICSKKCAWVVFVRLIQAVIMNSVVIFNASGDGQKVLTKDFVISIAKSYMEKGTLERNGPHEISRQSKQAWCSDYSIRTYKFRGTCDTHMRVKRRNMTCHRIP